MLLIISIVNFCEHLYLIFHYTLVFKHLFSFIADESKFPDALPDTDPWAYDVTWFQMEPEDAYIIRGKPATLTCRVASALKVSYILFVMLFPSKLLLTLYGHIFMTN